MDKQYPTGRVEQELANLRIQLADIQQANRYARDECAQMERERDAWRETSNRLTDGLLAAQRQVDEARAERAECQIAEARAALATSERECRGLVALLRCLVTESTWKIISNTDAGKQVLAIEARLKLLEKVAEACQKHMSIISLYCMNDLLQALAVLQSAEQEGGKG